MKVALVLPADPPGTHNFYQVPIGTLYTASRLRGQGFSPRVFDLRVRHAPGSPVYEEIADADCVFVLPQDYELAQCYPKLSPARRCIQSLRTAGAETIVAAGSHATVDAVATADFLGVDGCVAGEFEFAIPDFIAELRRTGTSPARFPHSGSRLASSEELALLGSPAFDLAPMNEYRSEGFVNGALSRVPSGLLLSNRGCPYACDFCYLFFERKIRRRPIEHTLREVKTMWAEHGIRHFFFLDYTFTLDERWVGEMCDGLEGLGLDISWICQSRVDRLSSEMLKHMKSAGCDGLWLGVESPDLDQRRYLGKGGIGFKEVMDGIELVRQAGIQPMAFVIVGLPAETEDSLESLNRWLDDTAVHYSLSTFTPRRGTPLGDELSSRHDGWRYLEYIDKTGHLGESSLRSRDLEWFFNFHDAHPRRVANIVAAAGGD